MANAPSRPTRPTNPRTLSARIGNLSAESQNVPNVKMGMVGVAPANAVDTGLQKFAQLILFGIAMIAIWAGLLSIAFGGEDTGQTEFLALGI
ncbi:MAG: hypothetical protein GWP21_04480, partial [Euryarchaeota archaeon]|nr:hypothetical protein [Euryarchaeota archaeon]